MNKRKTRQSCPYYFYTNQDYVDMLMCYGYANGNAAEARLEYKRRYPRRKLPKASYFIETFQRLRETGSCRPNNSDEEKQEEDNKNDEDKDETDGNECAESEPRKILGITKVYKLSPALADLMGQESMPRQEVIKRMWNIIKEKNLCDPKNKKFVLCDDAMYKVIGMKRFRTFIMTRYLKPHLLDG